jgi:dihydropteroate synthase
MKLNIKKKLASKDKVFYSKNTLNVNGNILDLSTPIIMGILNVTDDSFYDGGRFLDEKTITNQVEKLIYDGADIIDIGGYSSRPGAKHIDEESEFHRLSKGLKFIRTISPDIPVSIDTFRSQIAMKCLDLGANLVNDISAGELDSQMFHVVAKYQVPYIMMHMVGVPQNMAQHTHYDDLLIEIKNYFIKKLRQLTQFGVKDVIIDVGFGFSKTVDQNHELLKNLRLYQSLNVPILTGLSRKSMIYKVLETSPEQALNGTTVLNTLALLKGAKLLRVHDVKEAKEIVKLLKYIDFDTTF